MSKKIPDGSKIEKKVITYPYFTTPVQSANNHSAEAINRSYLLVVWPVVIYKDLYNYLLMTLDGKILRGLFEHEGIKPANVRTSYENVQNPSQLK